MHQEGRRINLNHRHPEIERLHGPGEHSSCTWSLCRRVGGMSGERTPKLARVSDQYGHLLSVSDRYTTYTAGCGDFGETDNSRVGFLVSRQNPSTWRGYPGTNNGGRRHVNSRWLASRITCCFIRRDTPRSGLCGMRSSLRRVVRRENYCFPSG